MTVYNTENPEEYVLFTAPMAAAELKGCHPVQNLGASISYLRRYLYVNALEIVEHDALDATTGLDAVKPVTPKPVPKAEPKPEVRPQTVEGASIAKADSPPANDWEIKISGNPDGFGPLIEQAVEVMLPLAQSADDVMSIYRRNKQIFEKFKAEDADAFKALMDKFSNRKKSFQEAA